MHETRAPWAFDATGGLGAAWRRVLMAAVTAPSIHNSQPWRFRLRPGAVDVLIDRDRQMHIADPSGRELTLSVGAAVFNLRVAMLAEGRQPILTAWPDPGDDTCAARISVGSFAPPDETVRALADAIPRRRTNRRPFADTPLAEGTLDDLAAAAQVEGGHLAATTDVGRRAVLAMVRLAEESLRADLAYRHELARWSHDRPERRDGVPARAFAPWSAVETVPLRDFGPVRRPGPLGLYERTPTIAVLSTAGDDRDDWLRAGQSMQRVLLTATVRGVASTLMTQPMEIPRLRDRFAVPGHVAQAVMRFGYAAPTRPTARRRLDEVILVAEPAWKG